MEPKFQSSFIPKGPIATAGMMPSAKAVRTGGLYGYIAAIIFVISLVLVVLVFGYKFYIKGRINSMSSEIAVSQGDLIPNSVRELIRLNDRIKSTETLLNNHVVVSPLFDFLESSTLKSVRFTKFSYSTNPAGVELVMEGQARSYAAIALQSDLFTQSAHFKNPIFSDLRLDESGNVVFIFKAIVNPNLISYQKQVEKLTVVTPAKPAAVATTSSATTTPISASTSTPPTN